jgi:uncharacterized membrane protein YbhN (UPF0104 family)
LPFAIASFLVLLLFYVLFSATWRRNLVIVGADLAGLSWLQLHKVFIYAFLTRYLPAGNVVTIGSRVGLFKSIGGSGSKGFEAVYHEQVYLTLGSFVLTMAALAMAPPETLPALAARYRWLIVIGLGLSVIALGLATDWVLGVVSRFIPISALDHLGVSLSLANKAELLGRFLVINVLQGGAAALAVRAVFPALPSHFSTVALIIAAYPLSRFIGQVAAVVPGGLGIREGAFVFFLGSLLPVQPLLLGGALIRLFSVLIELLNGAGIFLWLKTIQSDGVSEQQASGLMRHQDK